MTAMTPTLAFWSDDEPLECVLTRSGQDPVVVNLDIEGVADPEHVPWVDPAHPGPQQR